MTDSNFLIVGVGRDQGRNIDSTRRLHAQVVLIDKSHLEADHAPVYEMKEFERQYPSADSFAMMGGVRYIDKAGRQIFLTNGDIVSYEHLVITSAGKHTYVSGHDGPDQFHHLKEVLTQAIRLRRRVQRDLWTPRPSSPFDTTSKPKDPLNIVLPAGGKSSVLVDFVQTLSKAGQNEAWREPQVVYEVQV